MAGISYSLTTPKLGTVSASSLVKSATTLTNELNTYNDTLQKIQFENNPTDGQLNQYLSYLQDRVGVLNATGTITNASKALNLTQEMHTAISSNTSFNIQNESIQVLTGQGTDQQKLDYIGTAYQRAASIGDYKLAQSLESQGYNLQQSIAYHAQAQATANQVAYTANQTAVKNGYDNAVSQLENSWSDIVTAQKNGRAGEVQSALQTFTSQNAPLLKQYGVTLPKGATQTLAGAALGYMYGRIAYYNNAADALGTTTPEGQAMIDNAQKVLSGDYRVSTPYGSQDLYGVLRIAYSPSNLYSSSVDQNGQVGYKENAVTGYTNTNIKTPFGNFTVPIPTSNGNAETSLTSVAGTESLTPNTKGVGGNLVKKLQGLGFNPNGDNGGYASGGQIKVQLSDKAVHWLQGKGVNDLSAGDYLTLVPTAKGFQFVSKNQSLYGISFDNSGLAGLYRADGNNNYSLVGGQYGFNPSNTIGLQNLISGGTVQQIQTHEAQAKLQAQLSAANVPTANFPSMFSPPSPGALGGGSATPSFGGNPYRAPSGPTMSQRPGGGFNFTYQGKAISAAAYSQLTNTPFRSLLQNMANQGDTGAKSALGFTGNDYGYNPNAIGGNGGLYNALTWGTGHSFAGASSPTIRGGQLQLPSGLRL